MATSETLLSNTLVFFPYADLVARFKDARRATRVTRVALHHQCDVTSERAAKTAAILEFVDHVRSLERSRLMTVEAMADAPHDTGS